MVRRTENAGQKDCAQMWFGPDFRGSLKVQSMSWAEQGMYRHLLDLAWENHGIPSDLEDLRSILRLSPDEFAAAWKRIGRCFTTHPDDPSRLINERQEKERGIRADIRRKRAEAGERGRATQQELRNGGTTDAQGGGKRVASAGANAPQAPPQHGGLSPSPPPSPSRGILPSPAGPLEGTHSSCCTGDDPQQDDRSSDRGPAGPSGTGEAKQRQALFKALRATSFARSARDREHELLTRVDQLFAAGIEPEDLLTLAKKAARRGEKPGGLFAHWIRNVGEALKELGKR
jgi:hypothetical protein